MMKQFLRPLSVRAAAFLTAMLVMALHLIDIALFEPALRHPVQAVLSIAVAPLIVYLVFRSVIGPVFLRVRHTRKAGWRDILLLAAGSASILLCVLFPNVLYI